MTETKREKESSMCTRMLFVMNYSCRVETRQPSFLRCFSWKPTLWRWFDGRYSVGSLSPACSKPKVWLEPEGFTYKTLSYYYYFFEKKKTLSYVKLAIVMTYWRRIHCSANLCNCKILNVFDWKSIKELFCLKFLDTDIKHRKISDWFSSPEVCSFETSVFHFDWYFPWYGLPRHGGRAEGQTFFKKRKRGRSLLDRAFAHLKRVETNGRGERLCPRLRLGVREKPGLI